MFGWCVDTFAWRRGHSGIDRTRLIGRRQTPRFPFCLMPAITRTGGALLLFAAACAAPVATRPVPVNTTPVVVAPVVPVTPPPTVVRYAISATMVPSRYAVVSVATVSRDSAGRRVQQQLETRGTVSMQLQRRSDGAFSGSGQVTGYRLTSPLAATPVSIDSVRFDAVLDGSALRVVSRPPLVNECDQPETGALALARDLLWRVPATVAVGTTWRDSTVQLVCRAGIPLVVRAVHQYLVTGVSGSGDGVQLQLQRTDTTRLEGKGSSPWRALEVTGSGSGQYSAQLTARTGVLSQLRGETTLTLRMADRSPAGVGRVEELKQQLRLTADWLRD